MLLIKDDFHRPRQGPTGVGMISDARRIWFEAKANFF